MLKQTIKLLLLLIICSKFGYSQCEKIPLSDAYAKMNKTLLGDYSLELSNKSFYAYNINFIRCNILNDNCMKGIQFCLINNNDVFYKSVKFRLTIKAPDGKTIHNQIYSQSFQLKPDGSVPIKFELNKIVKSKYSFYLNKFTSTFEFVKKEVDVVPTVNNFIEKIDELDGDSYNEGKCNGIIERYEYILKIAPDFEKEYNNPKILNKYLKAKKMIESHKNTEIKQ